MRTKVIYQKLVLLSTLLLGGMVSLVAGQYYYFQVPASSSPYKQGCDTTLDIKATTETNITGAKAGLLRLQLDPTRFSYNTSDIASVLQTQLFVASTAAFSIYSNPSVYPVWLDTNKTILQIDRYNPGSNFIGTNRLYGTLKLIPKFSSTEYTGTVSIIYNGDTVRTSLSYGGNNIIVPASQNPNITGYYYVEQLPCQDDYTPPANTIVPNGGSKKSHISGIQLTLTENAGGGTVPYVWTGGLPGIGIWTGNKRGINNQYGVNFSTFQLRISGNSTGRYFTGGMFSIAGDLIALRSGRTRQFREKNYTININSGALFDYGIEKLITITGKLADRNNNTGYISTSFNAPIRPWLIAGSAIPSAGSTMVLTTAPVTLGIADDRAGVHSGTIIVTLSGINGTAYGPYVFSGSDLHLSGIAGSALQPDYYITINHPAFPSSGTIHVSVYAEDMVGNIDNINDYTFRTKPSCVDYGCFHDVYIQTGINLPFIYPNSTLYISGGINPYFTGDEYTGTVYCGTENEEPMDIYRGTEDHSGSAIFVNIHDLPNLILSGNSTTVKAVLSGHTLYLQRIYIPPITTGGGGGGSHLYKDDCLLPSNVACANNDGIDYSDSYYDQTCCASELTGHGAPTCELDPDEFYSEELFDAFNRAYNLNITTMCPFVDAKVPRKEIAKLISMFTIQIMGIFPDTNKSGCDGYDDTTYLSDEMKFFTKTACQLNLMGLEQDGYTPKQSFDPNDIITRAEFGTILSRLVYGDMYNIYEGEEEIYEWYEKHLAALKRDNVMTKIQDPFIEEWRSWILLMLYRSYMSGLAEKYRLVAPAHNGTISLLETVWK